MRVGNKKKPDYDAISRRSIAKDFHPDRMYVNQRKTPPARNFNEITDAPENNYKRIASISPVCEYAKYARFFVGRLVRLVESTSTMSTTGWYEFARDADRQALNTAAGWSDNKKRYLLERPKFR